jgi:putative ABC transport system substrate-binding protein
MVAINFDPIVLGYVDSLARPGANITGLFFQHLGLVAKRYGLFKEMLPFVRRVAVLSDPLTADQVPPGMWLEFALRDLQRHEAI